MNNKAQGKNYAMTDIKQPHKFETINIFNRLQANFGRHKHESIILFTSGRIGKFFSHPQLGTAELESDALFFNPSLIVALKQRLYGRLWYLQ